jgi:hypothetical protein
LTVGTSALIYIQPPGRVSVRQQTRECLKHATRNNYAFGLLRAGADLDEALQLIREGQRNMLLLAYRPDNGGEIEQRVREAGGQVEYCRPPRERPDSSPRAGHNTEEMIRRMADHGGTTGEIVRLLGVAEERVRPVLDRLRRRK